MSLTIESRSKRQSNDSNRLTAGTLHSTSASITESVHVVPEFSTAVQAFEQDRGRLFGIAYRMLGSVVDAEDIVQDAWIRWQSAPHEDVREPAAFLATITKRLSLNTLQSAHSRHETSASPWLRELETESDPQRDAEHNEALQEAMLILLGSLNPAERAAYVLREAFVYPYERIAQIVGTTSTNARQLVSRARKRLDSNRQASRPTAEQQRLLQAFISAAQHGNLTELEALFEAHSGTNPVDARSVLSSLPLAMQAL